MSVKLFDIIEKNTLCTGSAATAPLLVLDGFVAILRFHAKSDALRRSRRVTIGPAGPPGVHWDTAQLILS